MNDGNDLATLADLVRVRNLADRAVAEFIGRPATSGHLAEFVSSKIFDIEMHPNASFKASDGYFRSGPFACKSVNVKYGSRNNGMLDLVQSLDVGDHPDVYLVMTGPASGAVSSRKTVAPWVISNVYLFDSAALLDDLVSRGRVPGTATSVLKRLWDGARIYPDSNELAYPLTQEQRTLLKLFEPIPT